MMTHRYRFRALTLPLAFLVFSLNLVWTSPAVLGQDCNNNGIPDYLDLTGGPGLFGLKGTYPGGWSFYGAAAGDFNEDGNIDLVHSAGDYDGLLLSYGDGAGGFGNPAEPFPSFDRGCVLTVDFNQDGHMDVALAERYRERVVVFFGDGNGQFPLLSIVQLGDAPEKLIAADLNRDNRLDLVSIQYDTVFTMLNQGGGVFAPPQTVPAPSYAFDLVSADFNGDLNPDLAVVNRQGSVAILLGDGTGNLLEPNPRLTLNAYDPIALAGDFNEDSKPDLLFVPDSASGILLLAGNGAGGFAAPLVLEALEVGWNYAAVAVDLDLDSHLDVVVAGSTTQVIRGNGQGGFYPRQKYKASSNTKGLVIADYNNDGPVDIAAFEDDEIHVLIQGLPFSADVNGNGVPDDCDPDCDGNGIPNDCELSCSGACGINLPAACGQQHDWDGNGIPDNCAGEDCDANGLPDTCDLSCEGACGLNLPGQCGLAADCNANGQIDSCEAECNGNHVPDDCDVDPADPDGDGYVASDCNQNGKPDECEADCNANGVPDDCDIDPTDPDGDGEVAADCNANQSPDTCDLVPRFGGFYGLPGTLSFSSLRCSYASPRLDPVDLNGDGYLDILASCDNGAVSFLNSGKGYFFPGTALPQAAPAAASDKMLALLNELSDENLKQRLLVQTTDLPGSAAAGDLDGDGDLDLVNLDRYGMHVRFNNGDGTFSPPVSYDAYFSRVGLVGLGDLENDGDLDIVLVTDYYVAIGVFLNNGAGAFTSGPPIANYHYPQPAAMALADFDLDGLVDLVIMSADYYGLTPMINRSVPPSYDCNGNDVLDGCEVQRTELIGDGGFDNPQWWVNWQHLPGTSAATFAAGTACLPSNLPLKSLAQQVTIPAGVAGARLRFVLKADSGGTPFVDPTREFRVEIRSPVDDVLAVPFSTNPEDPSYMSWHRETADLSAFAGQTVTIAFVAQGSVSACLDAVSLQVSLGGTSSDCDGNGRPDECDPDADLDGVTDACDACPGTVPGAVVDASGCPANTPGDLDRDGDVDANDLEILIGCATGPAVPSLECSEAAPSASADLDSDGDVDAADFAIWQRCISGTGQPANPACAGD